MLFLRQPIKLFSVSKKLKFKMGNQTKKMAPTGKALVESYIKENPVLVFSKTYCPHCTKTKETLSSLISADNMKVYELDTLDNGADLQASGTEIHGQSTVPQVWIKQNFIGGNSDLQKLKDNGELQTMVKDLK